jgi:hypothetical protein
MRVFSNRRFRGASRLAISVAIFIAGCGAGRRFETAHLNHDCAASCEARWEECRVSCPQEAGAELGCKMKVCNPGRADCLRGCPPASFQ